MAVRRLLTAALGVVALLAPVPGSAAAGGLDWGFGSRGLAAAGSRVPGRALDIAVQRDGKILVSGSDDVRTTGDEGPEFGIARFDARGRIDRRFGQQGIARAFQVVPLEVSLSLQAQDLAIDPRGRIVLAAMSRSRLIVVRFTKDGWIDRSFGVIGTAELTENFSDSIGLAIAIQPDSKPIVVGSRSVCPGACHHETLAARFTENGRIDPSFGVGGIAVMRGSSALSNVGDAANDVVIQPDGHIVVAGTFGVGPLDVDASGQTFSTNFMIARLTSSGFPDVDFGDTGVVVSDVDQFDSYERIAVLRDGKMLVVGSAVGGPNLTSRVVLDRYNADGTLDSSFGRGGRLIMSGGVLPRMAVQPDGKIVVIDEFTIRRLLPNGKSDRTLRFVRAPGGIDGLTDVAIHPNGRILTSVRWRRDFAVAAFHNR